MRARSLQVRVERLHGVSDIVFIFRSCTLAGDHALAEAASDVILRATVSWLVKIRVVSPNSTRSPRYMKAVKSDTRGSLLHIVGHDCNRVVVLEFVDQFFDLGGRDRIQR